MSAPAGTPNRSSRPRLMPAGLRLVIDPRTRFTADGALVGGAPARVMRLSAAGREAMSEITAGPITTPSARRLARRLTDAGLAHPRPARMPAPSLTVVIPVRDRVADLDRCLAALGRSHPVLVVDDGSQDPAAVGSVAERHGASVVRRDVSGGPAAARNTAISLVDTELVALVDSDCVPAPGWIERLAGHLADPAVAVVAPRVVPAVIDTAARRYAAACGALDLGPREARVVPLSPVGYVPSAALVARRSALLAVARNGAVFDEAMRYGEDVDLVWRLHASGWRIRFDPAVTVAHREPPGWRELFARRYRYGTSAAPLAARHPGLVAPVVIRPLPALVIAALAARRPAAAVAGFAAGSWGARRTLRSAGVTEPPAVVANARLVAATWLGLARYLTQFAAPAVVAAALLPGRRRRSRGVLAAALLLTPALDAWRARRPAMNPAGLAVAVVADHAAYGAGVWAGALRDRTTAPLRPKFV